LRGISENEIASHNKKGIFSVTQLSYTFRARRKRKRAKSPSNPHYYALQALAIRDGKVYVHGTPSVPCPTPGIYFDIEGSPDRDSYYLIGLVVVDNERVSQYSFWANNHEEQTAIFVRFIEIAMQHSDWPVFHFGNYELTALRRIRLCLRKSHQKALDAICKRLVNILAIIHPYIYFPVHSNALKEIGHYLGFNWTDCEASGIQSVVWRTRWETNHDPQLKARLLTYNLEDCTALRMVVQFISIITSPTDSGFEKTTLPEIAYTSELQRPSRSLHMFGNVDYALPDFESINKCSYFDHQRDRVFVRTHPHINAIKNRRERKRRRFPKPNKIVVIACPSGGSRS
jgi:predicted RecB family nuclease